MTTLAVILAAGVGSRLAGAYDDGPKGLLLIVVRKTAVRSGFASDVFGRVMVEYDYPECTTAVVTALSLFSKSYPSYRNDEIRIFKAKAIKYIRKAQYPDGSWYGSWGICFTYAGMFALESLASIGEYYNNSENVRKGCDFLISKQRCDGGWSESYKVSTPPYDTGIILKYCS